MTKEQYEGTPELIFYCEYNPSDFEDRLEITFTNEYEITISKDKPNDSLIKIDMKPKKLQVPKSFFGKHIVNLAVIVGKNGIGKTSILDNISNIYMIKLFKLDDKFYIEHPLIDSCSRKPWIQLSFNGKNVDIQQRMFSKFLNNIQEYIFSTKGIRENKTINNLSRWHFMTSDTFIKVFQVGFPQEVMIKCGHEYRFDMLNSTSFNPTNVTYHSWMPNINSNIERLSLLSVEYLFKSQTDTHLTKKEYFIYIFLENLCFRCAIELIDYYDSDDDSIVSYHAQIKEFLELYNKCISGVVGSFIEMDSLLELKNKYVELYGKISTCHDIKTDIDGIIKWIETRQENDFLGVDLKLSVETINQIEIRNFLELLDEFANKTGMKNLFECKFSQFSSGEQQLLDGFSVLQTVCAENPHCLLILLDEPDARLHPEWSRKYLSYLLKFLNAEGERLGIKFQVILTTHSPYLISDLPKENIILLEKDEKTGRRTARKSNYGFASNYYDIMSDSFFLDDTIGEFAKQKINKVIKRLNHLSYLLDKKDSKSKKISNKFMQRSQLIFDHVNPIIQLIGDPFIKQQLDRMVMSINERLKVSCQPESKKELLEKQRAILEAQIKQIDQELGHD